MPRSNSATVIRENKRRSSSPPVLQKVKTGITGFDDITGGGIPLGRTTLVCGAAGCGKTLLGMQFLVRGALDAGEPGAFFAFEETEDDLVKNVASLGFDVAELERRKPDRPLKTNVEYYSAVVLDIAEVPPPLAPAMFACSRVAGWSAHILEQKRTGRLFRPSATYIGPAPRSLAAVS